MTLRGQQQEIYFYHATAGEGTPVKVLFLPGDGGWRGFAVDMARAIAGQGYDVYGWDIKTYLTGFTGKTTLSETEMMTDIREVARWTTQGKPEKVLLAGWSQGAGMVVLAAAAPQSEEVYRGVVAIGLPESALLGWRPIDDLTYITKKDPKEPTFRVVTHLPKVEPLPLAFIYSTSDEYITLQEAKRLFEAAREPKRYFEVTARNHRYDGNQSDFFRALSEALRWASLQ
jgi:dienelactone hydrolase